jgi:copper chaperone CopZ
MSQSKPKSRHRAHIASLTPGRLRMRLQPQSGRASTLQGIQADLQSCDGVQEVKVNPATGSVVMQFDPRRYSPAGILGLLEDIDVLVESIGHLPAMEGGKAGGGAGAVGFLAAVEDLSQRIRRATGMPVDLKLLLPLSFVGAGLWSIARRGLMIEAVPGWLFLWFAFDMFVKLHPVPDNKTAVDSWDASE